MEAYGYHSLSAKSAVAMEFLRIYLFVTASSTLKVLFPSYGPAICFPKKFCKLKLLACLQDHETSVSLSQSPEIVQLCLTEVTWCGSSGQAELFGCLRTEVLMCRV